MYRRDLRDTARDGLLADLAAADVVVQAAPEPGGGRVASLRAREGQIDLWLTGGASERRLTSEGLSGLRYGRADAQWVAWAPDGGAIAVVDAEGRLSTVDPDTGVVDRVTRGPGADRGLAWAPDGDRLAVVTDAFSRASLAVAAADGSGGRAWADDEFLYDDPRWAVPGGAGAEAAAGTSDDRPAYAVRSRHRDLFDYEAELVRVDADGPTPLYAREAVRAQCPRPRPGAPDEVAFVHDADGFDAVALACADADGGAGGDREAGAGVATVVDLYAVAGAEVADPAWHPAGDRLAVTVTRDGEAHVREVAVEGTGADATVVDETVHTDGRAFHTAPRFARAGDGSAADGDVDAGADAESEDEDEDEDGSEDWTVLAVGEAARDPPAVRDVVAGERLTPGRPAGLDERLPEPESLTYEGEGGFEVHAVVYPPDADAPSGSVPLLVKAHGGPTSFDRFRFDYRASYLAALGYAVICPNYRGSDGFGREVRMANDGDWGGGDLADVVDAADALAEAYDAVDGDRAGVYGGSGGGLMTVNALANADRFDAGAAFYGVYDYESFVDDTDDVGWQLMKRELGSLATDLATYRDASPIRSVESIEAPLLVLHGEADARVPISQSERLVEALEARGKRHEFRRYADEPHGFGDRENVVDAYTRVADLFAKYLRVDPDDGSSRPHHRNGDDEE